MSLLRFLDLAGVAVFAISGALTAGRKRLDLIGVLVIATVTAVGGGTLRDLLLDRHPIFWLQDASYLAVIAVAALGTVVVARVAHPSLVVLQRTLLVADALGLALFSISGGQIAERAGMPALAVVLLGTMTGSAGGMIRDVLTNEVPLLLRRGELYATAAIAGLVVYVLVERLGAPRPVPSACGMTVIVLVRLAAIWWRWALPEFALDRDEPVRRELALDDDEPADR
jgi:uncharacterized membrane protein YeiH